MDPEGAIHLISGQAESIDMVAVGRRLREVREAARIAPSEACVAIGLSLATYDSIESGDRALKGDELVILGDLFGVRPAFITGMVQVWNEGRFIKSGCSSEATMRDRLFEYFELDTYLRGQVE